MIAGAGIFLHYNDERRSIPKGHGAATDRARDNMKGPTIGGPFTLVDDKNCSVTERDLLENWLLFYFGYTSSPDIGPKELQKMAKAIDILESEENVKILPMFITLDPQRDTPSQLRAYLREIDPRIVGLTGSCCAMRQMAQEYRVYFKKVQEDGDDYLVETSHNMYFLDPKMEVVRIFGVEYDPEHISQAILKEIKKTEE
ncbi:hypothetical protein GIB67_003176 [Kingdonia uniflora]|uniref:Uncharacterized protein n=1 Tax=Kingdonia uniflora TaxID=39325 RepID=A0A7J7N6H3_9MAGN|nr:hypothetical protein GIB67_003176 [Kingdonia uniflora]